MTVVTQAACSVAYIRRLIYIQGQECFILSLITV